MCILSCCTNMVYIWVFQTISTLALYILWVIVMKLQLSRDVFRYHQKLENPMIMAVQVLFGSGHIFIYFY